MNNETIPVNYKGKVIGYTQDEGKTITFNDSEEAKLLLQSLDMNVWILSRGIGKVSEDNSVIEREITSLDICDLKNL